MTQDVRVAADWVWTGSGTPFPGTLTVRDGRVVEVSPSDDPSPSHDRARRLITPGLVNAHVHLDLTFERPQAALNEEFTAWLWSIKLRRDAEGEAGLQEAARRGIAQSLAAGTTTLVDYDSGGYSVTPLAESPIRRWLLREVIQFRSELHDPVALEEYLDQSNGLREYRGIAPHAPYTVAPGLRRELVAKAERRRCLWSIHFAEQPWEDEFLERGTGPFADFLARLGVSLDGFGLPGHSVEEDLNDREATEDTPWPLLVHGNYLSPNVISRLAAQRAAIVFCPQSHRFFGHADHPIQALREAGIPVCLGTDGQVSAGSLCLRDELRVVRESQPDLPLSDLWSLVTRVPRELLGPDCGGELVPGAPGDWVEWSIPDEPLAPGDVLEWALDPGTTCAATYIEGECVYRDR